MLGSVARPWDGATALDAASFIRAYGTVWIYVYDSSGTVFGEVNLIRLKGNDTAVFIGR